MSCALLASTMSLLSPSTRRAWIEIRVFLASISPSPVALHPEGVDRNVLGIIFQLRVLLSPSTRRAWIEIVMLAMRLYTPSVALHPEGVDRNRDGLQMK